jgi:hypothetical protein
MYRSALMALAVAAAFTTTPANAMMDCAKDYKNFWDKFMPNGPAAKLTGEQIAGASRASLRAYEACQAGDENFAKDAFEKIGQHLKKNER